MTNIFSGARRSNRPVTPGERKWTGIAFIVIGLVFLFIGFPKHTELVRLKKDCTADASAVVMRVEKYSMSRGRHGSHTVRRGVLEMPSELGVPSGTAVTPWSDSYFTESEVIAVKYDPSDPSRVYAPSKPPYDDGMRKMITSALFGGIGAIHIISYLLRKNR